MASSTRRFTTRAPRTILGSVPTRELASPDRAFIEAAVVGPPLASLTFSINLVCDVLADRDYGDPSAGPYGRDGALDRFEVSTPNTVVR